MSMKDYTPLCHVLLICFAGFLQTRLLGEKFIKITLKDRFISVAMSEIHHLMRGHEMNHLMMIDKYIFEKHPEFLKTVMLRDLEVRFSIAINKLRQYSPNEMLYAKLLYDPDECSVLSRRGFDVPATVATTIAKFKNSTFKNYYMNDSVSHKRVERITTRYLTMRYGLAPLAVGENDVYMKDFEREKYREKALRAIEAEETDVNEAHEALGQIILPVHEDNVI